MSRITLNSTPNSVFSGNDERSNIVAAGALLTYEYARKGQDAVHKALNSAEPAATAHLDDKQYKEVNERFGKQHLLYAAKMACASTGKKAPATFEEFSKRGGEFYGNKAFYAVLEGIYEDVLTPILPRVYSEAVSVFADVVEVGFAETYALTISSGDLVVFQDSAWGASRSVPENRFYDKTITLNPQPRTAEIAIKWHQMVGNNTDWGKYMANLVAGMYAKTMGMWNAAMTAAASNTALVPSGLIYNFSSVNWVTLANKISAVNNTGIRNLIAYGNAVALSKVLPTQATGSSNTAMDAALATLLGADYISAGYLGEYMGVRLLPLVDAVVPGSQFGNVTTLLPSDKIWMMAANARRPLVIAMNTFTPVTIEIEADKNPDFMLKTNVTTSLDSAAVFAQKCGLVNI
jgi:hypothetical protein